MGGGGHHAQCRMPFQPRHLERKGWAECLREALTCCGERKDPAPACVSVSISTTTERRVVGGEICALVSVDRLLVLIGPRYEG